MNTFTFVQGDAARLPLTDASVDLVVGSPPYADARLYLEAGEDLGIARDADGWVAWMLDVTREALRVSKGPVVWVCAGRTKAGRYRPSPEGLLWEAYKAGIACDPPVYWRRFGIPGSGGRQGFRRDVEYCLVFKPSPRLPWAEPTACGHPPKCKPGGRPSHRRADGTRVVGDYKPPALCNPGNLLDTGAAGGGNIGDALAHENEAPYPEAVPERFIRTWCPPGGIVLDPFSGSGTTVATAVRLGRRGIGIDLRPSQCELGRRRMDARDAAAGVGP